VAVEKQPVTDCTVNGLYHRLGVIPEFFTSVQLRRYLGNSWLRGCLAPSLVELSTTEFSQIFHWINMDTLKTFPHIGLAHIGIAEWLERRPICAGLCFNRAFFSENLLRRVIRAMNG
jgi:hypothetical protein